MSANKPVIKKILAIELLWDDSLSKLLRLSRDLYLKITYKKYKNTINNNTLSIGDICKSCKQRPSTSADIKKGKNWIKGVLFGLKDIPIQETPNIKAILEIFDPTTVPIAILSLWFKTEEIPTKISGADVPRATTVKPMVNSFTPNFFANTEELSTNLSAPHIKIAKENPKPMKFIRKSIKQFYLSYLLNRLCFNNLK